MKMRFTNLLILVSLITEKNFAYSNVLGSTCFLNVFYINNATWAKENLEIKIKKLYIWNFSSHSFSLEKEQLFEEERVPLVELEVNENDSEELEGDQS